MEKTQSLLSKAKAVKGNTRKERPPEKEAARLAVAWALGEVTYTQVQAALDRSRGASVYGVLACGLRDAVRLGYLTKTKGAS